MRHSLIAALILGTVTVSCGDDAVLDSRPGSGYFKKQTSPENVLFNLEEAYRQRDVDEYVKLLAPEFKFEFQQSDQELISGDFWTLAEDSAGTHNLFRAPIVSQVRVAVTHGPAEETTEEGFDPETLFIRVNSAFLEVDQSDGIIWQVNGDIQDMFFRAGEKALGEDPDHWFLIEWRDVPNPVCSPNVPPFKERTTWGALKAQY